MRMLVFFISLLLMGSLASAAGGSLYQVLGVAPNATQDVIKKAWRAKIKNLHPDRTEETEIIRSVNVAENILGNPELRAYYDYLSNYGADHERWEKVPSKNIASELRKRYGAAESLGTASYQPSASASSSSSSTANQPTMNSAKQNQILDLILRQGLSDSEMDNLAKVISQFVITDLSVADKISDIYTSDNVQTRLIGVRILKFALQANPKLLSDEVMQSRISDLITDASFEVAWQTQILLTRDDRLQHPDAFWNFLKFIKKYEQHDLMKILSFSVGENVNDTDFLPLQSLYRLRQIPDDEDIRRELADLLTSPNEMLGKVVARLLFKTAQKHLEYGELIKIQSRSDMLFAHEKMSLASAISFQRMINGHNNQDPKQLLNDLTSPNLEKFNMALRLLGDARNLDAKNLKSLMIVLNHSMRVYRETGSRKSYEDMRAMLSIVNNSQFRTAIKEDLQYFSHNVGNQNLSLIARSLAELPERGSAHQQAPFCRKNFF